MGAYSAPKSHGLQALYLSALAESGVWLWIFTLSLHFSPLSWWNVFCHLLEICCHFGSLLLSGFIMQKSARRLPLVIAQHVSCFRAKQKHVNLLYNYVKKTKAECCNKPWPKSSQSTLLSQNLKGWKDKVFVHHRGICPHMLKICQVAHQLKHVSETLSIEQCQRPSSPKNAPPCGREMVAVQQTLCGVPWEQRSARSLQPGNRRWWSTTPVPPTRCV